MDKITSAIDGVLDLTVASANINPEQSETAGRLLDGSWHIQTIGVAAEVIEIVVYCSWAVLQKIQFYANIKDTLTVEYLDFVKSGVIRGRPEYELFSKGGTADRLYVVDFELVVIHSV